MYARGLADAHSAAVPARQTVPWLTLIPLAVVMAYADGYWMMSLRGAVGAIERTDEPFASWLRESTAAAPVFVLAVLAALTLALRWFGPQLSRPRAFAATGLLIAVAGTIAGTAQIVVSSAWDYLLQLQLLGSLHHSATDTSLSVLSQATLGLQLNSIAFGSGILLVTNVVLTAWMVAMRGGRLDVSRNGRKPAGRVIDHRRLFVAAALFGSAAIHAAVIPEHLDQWAAAAALFLTLAVAESAVGLLLLGGQWRKALPAVAVASIIPIALWLYSRTIGLPIGPNAGIPEPVGLADSAAFILEFAALTIAVVLLNESNALPARAATPGPPAASAHVRSLTVVAVIAVCVLGLAGTVPGWFATEGGSAEIAHSTD